MSQQQTGVISKEDALNALIKGTDTNLISDGYHTFGELYEHRIVLFMALCKQYRNLVWMTEVHSDGTIWNGWFMLGMYSKPGYQITYHLPNNKWDECKSFAKVVDKAPEFDGHTSQDVLNRISQL